MFSKISPNNYKFFYGNQHRKIMTKENVTKQILHDGGGKELA
jgi:hypothetical protein